MTEEQDALNKKRQYHSGQIRGLRQYKNMSDDEFDELMAKREMNVMPIAEFEKRIDLKMKKFEQDYDLSEMLVNDLLTLRAICQALITLEDYEIKFFELRQGDTTDIYAMEKMNSMMSTLRKDISTMQDTLMISRKVRKNAKDTNVIDFIEGLKVKAKKFYESRMSYVYCTKCNELIATIWFQYPDHKTNKMTFVCHRKLSDGKECGNIFTLNSKDLFDNNNSNKTNVPEGLK